MTERGLRQKIARAGIRITPLINKALEQAKASHKEQKRDDGSPYLEQHIYPVASEMIDSLDEKRAIKRRRQISEKAIAAALLHDVLEDDRSLSDREFIRKFGREVYALVKPLTKPPKENRRRQSQEEKRRINEAQLRKISKAHRIARLIKLADR
jgi:(p)ppGpp synthase/HD superfamily hydrolase